MHLSFLNSEHNDQNVIHAMMKRAEETSGGEDAIPFDCALVGPSEWSARRRRAEFRAVEQGGAVFRVGDHVALESGGAAEWVCTIDALYQCATTGSAMFDGRWFWSPSDVLQIMLADGCGADAMRVSRCAEHELIVSDSREPNLCAVIARRCAVLSWSAFAALHRAATEANAQPTETVYFCERAYYHRAKKVRTIGPPLFRGDPVPTGVLSDAQRDDVEEYSCSSRENVVSTQDDSAALLAPTDVEGRNESEEAPPVIFAQVPIITIISDLGSEKENQ